MGDAPKRIWAKVEPDWHDGDTGQTYVGGTWDDGYLKDGTEYLRADLVADLIAASTALRDQIEQWHNGGPAAGPEESRALFEALDGALKSMGEME